MADSKAIARAMAAAVSADTLPRKGDRYKIRLQLYGHYDVKTVTQLQTLINGASSVASFFKIVDFEANSDDKVLNLVPMVSGDLENWSLYITVEYVGPNPPDFTNAQGSAAQFDPITLTVCVGAILLLLVGLVTVVGWTAEKVANDAKELSPFFLGAVIVALLYLVKK